MTPGYFPIFRVVPHRGRLLSGEDFQGGEPRVGVISHRSWRARWGGEESIVGSTITLNGHPITVVGVLPPRFEPPGALADEDCDIWLPLDLSSTMLPFHPSSLPAQSRDVYILGVVARLRPDVALETAQAELDALGTSLAEEYPEAHRLPDGAPRRYRVIPLLEATVGDLRQPLWLVMGAVGFLLLIACANVANLFLARGTDRQHEITLRLAFGAGYGRLTRLLLTESILISLAGGALGVGLAYHGIELLKWLSPAAAPRMEGVVLDQRVLWFALAVSVATGALFGMAPALQAARTTASNVLKDAGATATSSRARLRLRDALVVSEIVVALVLLAGAGLLFNSFVRLITVDPGIDPEHLTVVPLELGSAYSEEERLRFARDLGERIEAIPGVEGVAAGVTQPFTGREGRMCCSLRPIRLQPQTDGDAPEAIVHPVTHGYFEVLGARVIRGRKFTPADSDPGAASAVMNVALARQVFGEEDAVGRSFYLNDDQLTVVGVVENIRHWGLQHGQTGRGRLRLDALLRAPAPTRDRHPRRARRHPGRHGGDDRAPRDDAHRHGDRLGHGRCSGALSHAEGPGVRDHDVRSVDLCGGVPDPRHGRLRRLLRARVEGGAGGPDGGPAERVGIAVRRRPGCPGERAAVDRRQGPRLQQLRGRRGLRPARGVQRDIHPPPEDPLPVGGGPAVADENDGGGCRHAPILVRSAAYLSAE